MNKGYEQNNLGGLTYIGTEEIERAMKADLITLPKDIQPTMKKGGTNCFNCEYIQKNGLSTIGNCRNAAVKLPVTTAMCCALWDRHGALRSWK